MRFSHGKGSAAASCLGNVQLNAQVFFPLQGIGRRSKAPSAVRPGSAQRQNKEEKNQRQQQAKGFEG